MTVSIDGMNGMEGNVFVLGTHHKTHLCVTQAAITTVTAVNNGGTRTGARAGAGAGVGAETLRTCCLGTQGKKALKLVLTDSL